MQMITRRSERARPAGWHPLLLTLLLALAGCPATLPIEPAGDKTAAADASDPAARKPAPAEQAGERQRLRRQLQSHELGLANLPEAQAFVDGLLQRIQSLGPQPARFAQVLIRPRLSYNAATTPEGFIVIDLGWLKSIDGEAELTALLAHEYAHIILDHMGGRGAVGTAAHAASIVGVLYASRTGSNNALAMNLARSTWTEVLSPSWSRSQEFEADKFALETTQAMGLAYVPSIRAFLERIQSVERAATRPTAAAPVVRKQGGTEPALSADHPPIDERIAQVQQLIAGKPRVRPATPGQDGWRSVKASPEFARGEQEYLLADSYFQALRANNPAEAQRLARLIGQRPRPLQTAAAMTALASAAPADDAGARNGWLRAAIAAPDASFLPYRLQAGTQRDVLKQYEAAGDTIAAGMERFDSPPSLMPEVVEFMRVINERIEGMPAAQRPGLFKLQNNGRLLLMNAQCLIHPEVADACAWANLTERQKAEKVQLDQNRQEALQKSLDRRVQKLLR